MNGCFIYFSLGKYCAYVIAPVYGGIGELAFIEIEDSTIFKNMAY